MGVSIYNPYLLYTNSTAKFSLISLQTNNTLFLKDRSFVAAEKIKLKSTKFMAKNWEELITATPIKFNSNYITLNKDSSIILTRAASVRT